MKTFGRAGVPSAQFDLRIRFGYHVTVAIWDTREELRLAIGAIKQRLDGCFDPRTRRGRLFGCLHLCRPALDLGTLAHELKHVFFTFERDVATRRFRDEHAFSEAMATEFERCLLALQSHIAEEMRLAS